VTAALLTAELVLYGRSRGQTVLDQLGQIYAKHGYFREIQISRKFEGQQGSQIMEDLMDNLRSDAPKRIGGLAVTRIRDYRDGTTKDRESGETKKSIDLPSSDVLQFVLEDASVVTVRPSGTEPKIKFYASCRSRPETPLASAHDEVAAKLDRIEEDIEGLISRSASSGA
jgi:phosphoglucomutase